MGWLNSFGAVKVLVYRDLADVHKYAAAITTGNAGIGVHVRVELPGLGLVGRDVELQLRSLRHEVVHLQGTGTKRGSAGVSQGGAEEVRLGTHESGCGDAAAYLSEQPHDALVDGAERRLELAQVQGLA